MSKDTNHMDLHESMVKAMEAIGDRISLMATIQLTIIEHLGDKSPTFQNKVIMNTLADKKVRNNFTEYINEIDEELSVPDNVKARLIELNEMFAELEEDDNA
jgi:uncharacterized membrane-anchored protein YjiN (DUF445 family)